MANKVKGNVQRTSNWFGLCVEQIGLGDKNPARRDNFTQNCPRIPGCDCRLPFSICLISEHF